MNKQEFLDRLKGVNTPTDEQWEEIEYVYTWHPCISDRDGKDQIVTLWNIGGIRLIRDMKPTAEKAQIIEHKIELEEAQIRKLRFARLALEVGENGDIDE